MRSPLHRFASGLAAYLIAAPPSARAAPQAPQQAVSRAPRERAGPVEEVLREAEAAWTSGQWSRARSLLEPLADDPAVLEDPVLRTQVLPMLADATLADESMAREVRRRLAARYIDRLLTKAPDFRLPQGVYGPELNQVFVDRLQHRERAESAACIADRNACRADLAELRIQHRKLQSRHRELQRKYLDQEVEVRSVVKRSRIFALIPFGVGHFYNGLVGRKGVVRRRERINVALGATFLTAEAAFGVTGIALVIQRLVAFKCKRTAGFERESLRCAVGEDKRNAVERTRKAEEVMGWAFLGTAVLDIVLAQVRFQPLSTAQVRRVPRRVLERDRNAPKGRKPPRATLRPGAGWTPGGAALYLKGRF